MIALQAVIGTANDLIDEPLDRGHKPGKPLPRGLISRRQASWLLAVALTVGLILSSGSGLLVLVVAVAGTSIGLIYDRWLKGTVWSWLPLAVGIPLLPVYAWLGAADGLPASFSVLIPTAIVAGAALAFANLLADVERDRVAGVTTAATRLGPGRTWLVCATLYAVVVIVAATALIVLRGTGPGLAAAAVGCAAIVIGLLLARRPIRRAELAWEIEAVGTGLLAVGWVAALVEAGTL